MMTQTTSGTGVLSRVEVGGLKPLACWGRLQHLLKARSANFVIVIHSTLFTSIVVLLLQDNTVLI